MRRVILTFLAVVCVITSYGQIHLFVEDAVGGVGDQVIVPVRVNDFVDLVGAQGSIHFDPSIIDAVTVEQFGLPGMSIGNFGTTQSTSGTITFSWFDGDLSGENLADSSVLFALRFDIIGNPGDISLVWLDDSPTLLEFVNSAFVPQPYTVGSGEVEVTGVPGSSSFTLFGDSIVADINDTIVVPIRVKNFSNIIGVQGTIGFDETVADYIAVEQYGVSGMSNGNFGETMVNNGLLTFSWNSLSTAGETLADSSILFGIKYHIIAGAETDISFFNSPTPIEIVDSTLTILNPVLSGGHIEVLPDTSQLFELLIDSVIGQETQLVNVPVRAYAFNEIISMQGTFGFDTSALSYNSVVNINLPYLNTGNFGTSQVNNGLLSYSWFDADLSSETILDSTVLFELQFEIIGDANECGEIISNSNLTPIEVVELGNLPVSYMIDSGAVCIDSLGFFINLQDPINSEYCAGDSIHVVLEANLPIGAGNVYTLELSDETGSFANPITIGTLASTLDSTLISGLIPVPITMGTGYKVRVSASDQFFIGSPINLNLSISYYEDSIETTACFGDSLFLGGMWQTTAGFYTDTLSSVNGCDSVIVTNFSFTTELVDSVYTTICDGDSLFLENAWQTTPGWYVDSLVSESGCDSLIRTNLLVNSVASTSTDAFICMSDSLFVGGEWQVNEGVYMDTLTAINGCDSIIATNISFYPADTINVSEEICFGDSLFLGGVWQMNAGTYTDVYASMFGCDSLVITQLSILPITEIYDSVQVCFGDSLFIEGSWQTNSGDYIDVHTAVSGCDSIIYTNLVVENLISTTTEITRCFGDSLFAEGSWQMTSGTYTDIYSSVNGCDSLEIVNLTILDVNATNEELMICAGDSLMIHGMYQSSPGTYIDTVMSANGCDSISSVVLFIETQAIHYDSLQICVGDSVFLQGGWQTSSGDYSDTLSSALGCDSITQTYLDVINLIQTISNVELCAGDSLFVEGAWQFSTGIYNDTLTAAAGCDSVATVDLIVLDPITGIDNAVICSGDSILIGGAYQTTAGIYTEVLTAANGCDSTVSITLSVNASYFIQEILNICQGDSAFLDGAYQTVAGIYIETGFTTEGCDSIVETQLIVNPIVTTNTMFAICTGDSMLIHGNYETIGDVYSDTLLTAAGCDSISNVTLAVNPVYFEQVNEVICQGDSIFLQGAYQMDAGIYLDTTATINGCDSIVETTLTVNPSYFEQNNVSICQGDSVFLQGAYQYSSGVYQDVMTTNAGCDSIIETTLTVNPAPTYFETIEICQGDSIAIHGIYQNTAGVYIDTFQTASGCDSIAETTLTVNSAPTSAQSFTICDGETIDVHGNTLSMAGVYVDTLQTASGCDSIVETTLNVTVIDNTVTNNSPTLMANYAGATSYQWINCNTGFQIGNATDQEFEFIANGSYQVLITDQGCSVFSDCETVDNVSVDELNTSMVQVYPNPTQGEIIISNAKEGQKYVVLDAMGKIILNGEFNEGFNTLNLMNRARGMYLLKIEGKTFKVNKQ